MGNFIENGRCKKVELSEHLVNQEPNLWCICRCLSILKYGQQMRLGPFTANQCTEVTSNLKPPFTYKTIPVNENKPPKYWFASYYIIVQKGLNKTEESSA